MFWGQLTHTVVVCTHTVVVCVVEGEPLINMGLWKLFSSSVLRSNNPHNGCMYPSVVVCVVEGELLINMGLWKLLFSIQHGTLEKHGAWGNVHFLDWWQSTNYECRHACRHALCLSVCNVHRGKPIGLVCTHSDYVCPLYDYVCWLKGEPLKNMGTTQLLIHLVSHFTYWFCVTKQCLCDHT